MKQPDNFGEWVEVKGKDLIEEGYVCTACGRYIHDFLPLAENICTLEFEKELVSEFRFCPNCDAGITNHKELQAEIRKN